MAGISKKDVITLTAEKILEFARGEIGITESPPGSNKVKYNTIYYGREVQGASLNWCAVFIWWLFHQAGVPELFYDGQKTAYCPTLLYHHRAQRVTADYKPGDIIFFNFQLGFNAQHVGICESFDGTYITTIDGNTGTQNEANGGAVMRRTRHKKYIVGAYRPAYEEEDNMTQEQFDAMMENYLARQKQKEPTAEWMIDGIERAKQAGISDGSSPLGLCTRAEAMMMAAAAKK